MLLSCKTRFLERLCHTTDGRTPSRRYLIVFFVLKPSGRALVISGRDMTRKEDDSMRKNNRKPIPKRFATLEQAGNFWDTHDLLLADYWEQTEEVPISFQLRRKRHLVSIAPSVARDLHAAAKSRGVSAETIANKWLREMLAKERTQRKSRTAAQRSAR